MKLFLKTTVLSMLVCGFTFAASLLVADESATPSKETLKGQGPGWRDLTEADFVNVNCNPDTWTWKDGLIQCTGTPVGVIRTKKEFTNLELVVQWRHLKPAGQLRHLSVGD